MLPPLMQKSRIKEVKQGKDWYRPLRGRGDTKSRGNNEYIGIKQGITRVEM